MKNKNSDFKELSAHAMPEESLGYLLWRVSTTWRTAIEAVLKPLDLTHPQFVVLAVLGWLTRAGTAVSQADIGGTAGLDPNTTSQIVRLLEAKGFITRLRSIDERSKNPLLTDQGSDVLAWALPAVEEADKAFFALLSSEEAGTLKGHFRTLLLSLGDKRG